ncbi:MAG: DNA methyltransferase, partial [Terriglobia bacterium]
MLANQLRRLRHFSVPSRHMYGCTIPLFPDETDVFQTPKPTLLVRRLLEISTKPDSVVLDSFAGSGTTGSAMIELNKRDGGSRRVVLVELDAEICRKVTAERLKRAERVLAPQSGRAITVPDLRSGFRYCELGQPLFDADGSIWSCVNFAELAAHFFFTETGAPTPKRASGRTPLLGVHTSKAVYLLFNGVMETGGHKAGT